MPWLTIISFIVAFFVAGGAKKENRTKAALIAAGVGAAVYGTTHYTDWGEETLGRFDGIEITNDDDKTSVEGPDGSKDVPKTGVDKVTTEGNGGFWNAIGGWLKSPAGQVTTGAAGASAAGIPNWMILGGAAVGIYLLTK